MLPKLNETSETEMVDPDPTERPLNKIHVSQSFSYFYQIICVPVWTPEGMLILTLTY